MSGIERAKGILLVDPSGFQFLHRIRSPKNIVDDQSLYNDIRFQPHHSIGTQISRDDRADAASGNLSVFAGDRGENGPLRSVWGAGIGSRIGDKRTLETRLAG